MNQLKSAFEVFDKKQKRSLVYLTFIIFIDSFVELLGVTVILPFINAVIAPEQLLQNKFAAWAYDTLGMKNTNEFIIVIAAMIILFFVMNRTCFGRHVYAVGGNRESARYAGVNVKWVQIRVFLISGLTAALAGVVLAARLYSGQPNVGEGFERDAIAASVLGGTSMGGGVGTLGGTVIGVLIIGVLNNGMNLLRIDTYWQYVVKGVVILGAVYMDYIKRVRAAKK